MASSHVHAKQRSMGNDKRASWHRTPGGRHLGFGKCARADRIFALERITGEERGDGRRTRVWIDGVTDPLIASRTEITILRDIGQESAVGAPELDEAMDLAARLAAAAEEGRGDLRSDPVRRCQPWPKLGVTEDGTRMAAVRSILRTLRRTGPRMPNWSTRRTGWSRRGVSSPSGTVAAAAELSTGRAARCQQPSMQPRDGCSARVYTELSRAESPWHTRSGVSTRPAATASRTGSR